MELTQRERDVAAQVLFAYAEEWMKVANKRPDALFNPATLASYFAGEAVVTLQNRNDVLGDEIA